MSENSKSMLFLMFFDFTNYTNYDKINVYYFCFWKNLLKIHYFDSFQTRPNLRIIFSKFLILIEN